MVTPKGAFFDDKPIPEALRARMFTDETLVNSTRNNATKILKVIPDHNRSIG